MSSLTDGRRTARSGGLQDLLLELALPRSGLAAAELAQAGRIYGSPAIRAKTRAAGKSESLNDAAMHAATTVGVTRWSRKIARPS